MPIHNRRTVLAAVGLLAFIALPACGGRQPAPQVDQTGGLSENGSDTTSKVPGDPLAGFTEGPGVPEGWPVAAIPLPPGAVPVASLRNTTAPGTDAEANVVFYSAEQSFSEIHAFMIRELPAKGWKIIESSPPGDYLITTAEGHGYVGIFGTGIGFGPSEVSSGQKIALLVILAKSS
jgi:hypothetical protein